MASKRALAVLVLAAGRGTRMRSELPKVLHPAGGRTLLAHVLAAVTSTGIPAAAIAVVAGYRAEAVRVAVQGLGMEVLIQEPQLGTGHALRATEAWWRGYERLIVVHGDMPLLSAATVRGLAHRQQETGAAAVLATAAPSEPRAYGRILRDPARPERIIGIVEARQATPEQLCIRELNAGFYCFQTAPLTRALAQLGTDNPHGEYYLTDAIARLAAAGETVAALPLADERECLGVNDQLELAELDRDLRRRKAEALLRTGVSIQFPDTLVIDPEVTVGADTVLEAGVQLLGATRIGARCRIRSYTICENSVVGDGVLVRPHCVLENAHVDESALLGPFTRLREGSHIGEGAHVGNFVEVKKTRLGRGSKANHLAYLGDATIGDGANVGAGTITCNYDGVLKHPTQIGDGAFIGSNSTLVAPVEIGAGAYVAAGSVITESVPADALALGRGRQTVKPGWSAARRASRAKPAPH
ncbi:MAG: bifunctional UDP-N-acetylglucosamine diphosphorylase/glucosamine-1-phosphate N-acetyltransferase GlmU [Terriglobales bacterium]